MAVNPLSLAESLRPWRAAGVTHFLRDILGEGVADIAASSEPSSTAVWRQTRKAQLGAMGLGSSGPAPEDKADLTKERTKQRHDTWPEAWQELFARTKPAPILWTYPELGLDLGGQGCTLRSACLRELIGKLQLSKGSSTFWPLCLGAEENGAEAGIFKGGLFLLEPKVVVLIGPRSASFAGLDLDLGLDLHTPFTQQIARGMLFVLLPEFPAMLENAALADKACVFLRSALARISV